MCIIKQIFYMYYFQEYTDKCSLSLGLHIQVLYASVGALANPQSKILGVALLYDDVKDVKFRVSYYSSSVLSNSEYCF